MSCKEYIVNALSIILCIHNVSHCKKLFRSQTLSAAMRQYRGWREYGFLSEHAHKHTYVCDSSQTPGTMNNDLCPNNTCYIALLYVYACEARHIIMKSTKVQNPRRILLYALRASGLANNANACTRKLATPRVVAVTRGAVSSRSNKS